ncbi:hypothetical protein M4951_04785 [Blastopirellula sp. J2-11]|uniref:hypothetical protein n=1 Tax=Blastopirellula sp. J2-11 TaxID=2943192 RepID=UPI0021C7187B|nr:hypothetical protein [Blastopirellula sp. J2-11]UUO07625.1 hypothetical protein M4951_04785 [Blastopirellula sp. J2-11]
MPSRHQWQSRIKSVEREFVAIRQGTNRFLDHAQSDPTILLADLRQGEIVSASRNLEGTYIMRLFAEFETGARQFWDETWGTEIKTFNLFEGLAARRGIPDTDRINGHLVRDYRNSLVHERDEQPDPLSIALARRYLCTFFSYLPVEW